MNHSVANSNSNRTAYSLLAFLLFVLTMFQLSQSGNLNSGENVGVAVEKIKQSNPVLKDMLADATAKDLRRANHKGGDQKFRGDKPAFVQALLESFPEDIQCALSGGKCGDASIDAPKNALDALVAAEDRIHGENYSQNIEEGLAELDGSWLDSFNQWREVFEDYEDSSEDYDADGSLVAPPKLVRQDAFKFRGSMKKEI